MKKLIVLSGGMDSATILGKLAHEYPRENIKAISFHYGSKHNDRENISAHKLALHYGIEQRMVSLPFINELFKSDLLMSGGDIPEGHYEDPSMRKTVVPFRNGIMLAIAVGYAESIEADTIYVGNHAGDHAIYPDCRMSFIIYMDQAIREGTYSKIKLISPYCNETKADIVRSGVSYRVPYELTYSCYKGAIKHCGKCGTCFERKEAFERAGIIDPTEYDL
jgi:7-cyano-7-deazaguanine synthase